jgi:hypothetical protein
MERHMNQRVVINLTTKQMKALELHWRDFEVMMAAIMLLVMSFTVGAIVWVVW